MGLRSKTLAGISTMGLLQAIQWGISFGTSIFLYRLLSARDFGIFVLCEFYLMFAQSFADMGMESAVIQKKENAFEPAYFIRIICALLGMLILILSAWPLGLRSGHREMIEPLRMLSIVLAFQLISFKAEVFLKKEMAFSKLFFPELYAAVASSVCSLFLAFSGWGYWSLVGSTIAAQMVRALFFVRLTPPWPFPGIRLTAVRQILYDGWHIFLTGLLFYLLQRTGHFLAGNFLSLETLGFFALAFNWANFFVTRFVHLVNRVVFPAASSVAEDRARIIKIYEAFLSKMSFLATPFHLGLALLGPLAIPIILGEKWLPSVPYFQALCFYGYLRSLASVFHTLLQALGSFRLISRLLFVEWMIYAVGGFAGLHFWNLWGIVIPMLVAKGIIFIFLAFALIRQLNLSKIKTIFGMMPSLISGLAMALVVGGALQMRFFSDLAAPLYLMLLLSLGVLSYLLSHFLLFPVRTREMFSLWNDFIKK